ncbi:lipocalin family protein [Desulfovibrio sp. DV]|uniref:lipocalin family protein n=1 Tax=Desulfovibrio sp. DV TaxID=1844708 RepID=UPI000A8E6DB2|nr:lipocalin family protein [Desulfovibrio sp. DV]
MFKYIVLAGACLSISIVVVAFSKSPLKYIMRDLFSKEMPLETVKDVDLGRYQGVWYSVYEYYAWFQAGCKCTRAEYSLADNGKVEVKNSCYRNGALVVATAIAWPINEGDNSKLYVQFKAPFKGKYYILSIDEGYQHALVGTPDRNYLWILSREKTIDANTFNEFELKANSLGFDCSRLLDVNQECTAPD